MIQVIILLTGAIPIWITQQSNESIKKYACLVGLSGQPFWFYETFSNQQYGIFVLTILYTAIWIIGFYNYWIKNR